MLYSRNYGWTNFVGDAIMVLTTFGLWGFWIVSRETNMQYRSYCFTQFLGDLFMISATFGFWFAWILYREIQLRKRY